MRRYYALAVPFALVLAVLLAITSQGCSSQEAALREQIDAQATQIAELRAAMPVATAAATATQAPTPIPTLSPTPAPTSTTQAVTYDTSIAGSVRYVAHTGGMGVRVRSHCSDDAPGSGGWPEGARVFAQVAKSDCPGWVQAESESGQLSWVRVDYLSAVPPPTRIPEAPRQVAAAPPRPAGLFIEVVSITSPVTRGQGVELVLRTLPGATCTAIHPRYWAGPGEPTTFSLGRVTTGADGIARFRWATSTRYLPGYEPGGTMQKFHENLQTAYDPERYRLTPSGGHRVDVLSELGGQVVYNYAVYVVQ